MQQVCSLVFPSGFWGRRLPWTFGIFLENFRFQTSQKMKNYIFSKICRFCISLWSWKTSFWGGGAWINSPFFLEKRTKELWFHHCFFHGDAFFSFVWGILLQLTVLWVLWPHIFFFGVSYSTVFTFLVRCKAFPLIFTFFFFKIKTKRKKSCV